MLALFLVVGAALVVVGFYLDYRERLPRRQQERINREARQAEDAVNGVINDAVNQMYEAKRGRLPSWRRW